MIKSNERRSVGFISRGDPGGKLNNGVELLPSSIDASDLGDCKENCRLVNDMVDKCCSLCHSGVIRHKNLPLGIQDFVWFVTYLHLLRNT